MLLEPMLASSANEAWAATLWDPWILEPKFDGVRVLVDHQTLITRNGTKHNACQFPQFQNELLALPLDTVLDCELIYGLGLEGSLGPVSGALHSIAPTAPDAPFSLVVFDVLKWDGINLTNAPFSKRRLLLEMARAENLLVGGIRVAPQWRLAGNLSTMLDFLLDKGYEGVMLKNENGSYLPGCRSRDVLKLKPQKADEYVVWGFKPGDGKYAGQIGAIEFGHPVRQPGWGVVEVVREDGQVVYVRPVSRCSGFSDELRAAISHDPDAYLGRVITVKHHGVSKHGKPRHPQFGGWRVDLEPSQVV